MRDATTTGVAALLAAVLVTAGTIKAVEPRYVAAALRRTSASIARRVARSERRARRVGRAVGTFEVAVGVALLVATGVASVVTAAIAAALFTTFLVVVSLAVRRGAACGCWASLSEGPAAGAELGRGVALLGATVAVLVARAGGSRDIVWNLRAVVAAIATLLAVVGLTWFGHLLRPVRDDKVRERLSRRAPDRPLPRAAMQIAFLFGFVHAGTPAGQRRYVEYLNGRLRAERQAAASADSTPFHRSGSVR